MLVGTDDLAGCEKYVANGDKSILYMNDWNVDGELYIELVVLIAFFV